MLMNIWYVIDKRITLPEVTLGQGAGLQVKA